MVAARLGLLSLLVLASPAGAQQVASIQLSPKSLSLAVGGRQTVLATANAANGAPVTTRFRWTSSDATVVRIEVDEAESDFAELIAVGPGSARVSVQAGGRTETIAVTVTGAAGLTPGAAPVAASVGTAAVLTVDPPTVQLLFGEKRQLRPVFLRADGQPAAAGTVVWSALNPAIATIDPSGVVVGLAVGQAAVQATAGSLSKIVTVEVADAPFAFGVRMLGLSPATEMMVTVVVPSQRNRQLANQELTWRSSNEAVARVTPLGVVRALAPGRATVVAEGFSQVRELPVTVHRPVAFVDATPPFSRGPVQVPLNGTQPFRIVSRAADESEIPEAPVLWTVADTNIAAFDEATGRLMGRGLGETTLKATPAGPGLEIEWRVAVIAGGLAVTPDRAGFGVGESLPVKANFITETGSVLGPATGVQWITENANVVGVTGEGVISGVSPGRSRVIAQTGWGRADTVDVFISGSLLLTSTRDGSADLFATDPAAPAQGLAAVARGPSNEVMGAWSPDGSRIVFVSDRDGNYELYLADADGANATRLTTTPDLAELSPEWTPDGRQIVHVAQPTSGRAQIRIMNSDGTTSQVLTSDRQGANLDPAVSPDGRLIAFTSTRDGNYEVYLMALDGSEQRPALVSPLKESKPAWFPNGDLAFIQERTDRSRIVPQVVRQSATAGALPQVISPPEFLVTDFAVSGREDALVLEVVTASANGRFDRSLVLLRPGTPPTELPRQPGEQQSAPALRLPLTH